MPGHAFRTDDADRWHAIHGAAADPYAQPDIYDYDLDEEHPLSEYAAMSVGIYVAVDEDETVRYIGQVRRPGNPAAVRERHHRHHKANDEWVALWLLPLRDTCTKDVVDQLERELIRAYDPIDNATHARHNRDD